jgi:hypothetical protein
MSSEYNSLFWFHLSHVNSIVRIFVLRFLRFLFHLLVISEYNLHMFSLFESMIFLQLIGIIVFQFRSRFCFEFHFMIFHSSTVDSWWWQSHNFVLLLLLLHVLENHRFSSVIRCIERLIRCSIVDEFSWTCLWFLAFFEEGLFWCLIQVKIHWLLWSIVDSRLLQGSVWS